MVKKITFLLALLSLYGFWQGIKEASSWQRMYRQGDFLVGEMLFTWISFSIPLIIAVIYLLIFNSTSHQTQTKPEASDQVSRNIARNHIPLIILTIFVIASIWLIYR
jgi:uncharacterized paraquat-inducible protein A